MSLDETEPDFGDILDELSIEHKVLILVIRGTGSLNTTTSETIHSLMEYKCVREFIDRGQVITFSITAGSVDHKNFVNIYGVAVAPLIVVLGLSGRPTGLIKVDPGCETHCALLVNLAVRAALTGDNALLDAVITEKHEKSINTTEGKHSELMEFREDALTVDVYETDKTTRDVTTQCSLLTSNKIQKPLSRLADNAFKSMQDGTQRPNSGAIVWSTDRTSPLSPEAVSRLQILLPNRGPVHAAVSAVATLMDVSKFVSSVLKIPIHTLELSTRYPHHIFSESEMLRKVHELGLVPSAVLIVRIKTELIRPTWGLSDVIHNLVATVTKPFLAVLSGFWSRVQSIFYSSSEEDEADDDDDDDDDDDEEDDDSSPHRPKKRQGNVRTLFDEDDDDDDGRDRVPNYNGNSTQLL